MASRVLYLILLCDDQWSCSVQTFHCFGPDRILVHNVPSSGILSIGMNCMISISAISSRICHRLSTLHWLFMNNDLLVCLLTSIFLPLNSSTCSFNASSAHEFLTAFCLFFRKRGLCSFQFHTKYQCIYEGGVRLIFCALKFCQGAVNFTVILQKHKLGSPSCWRYSLRFSKKTICFAFNLIFIWIFGRTSYLLYTLAIIRCQHWLGNGMFARGFDPSRIHHILHTYFSVKSRQN